MSIKISNFVPLNAPSGNDIIPIIDVSEPNTADQNKKITVDNLLSLATGQENPYIKVTYTEDILPTAPDGNLIIGEAFNKYSDPPYTNRIPDGYNIVLGSFNSINAPNNNTEVYGEFKSPFVRIFGNENNIGQNCREASIIGSACGIAYNAAGALILGTNSAIGDYSNTADPLAVNDYSIAIGDSVNIQGNNCTAIGYVSKIYNKSANSIAIGTGARIGDTTATTPSDSAIALGDNAKSREDYSISVGYNSISSARYGVAIGAYSEIEAGATDSFCFGGYVSSTAEESISIGLYSYTNGPASIAIGPRASANPATARAISIGDGSAARAANSIVIGGNNGVNNTCSNSISIGDESGIFSGGIDAIILGSNNNINNNCQGSISIGKGNTIFTNSPNCVALGYNANVATALTNSIQLGTGTASVSNTLQFLSQPIANSTSIQIRTQTTNVAPTSTPADGTLILDQTGNGKLWVRVNGTWKSTTLS